MNLLNFKVDMAETHVVIYPKPQLAKINLGKGTVGLGY